MSWLWNSCVAIVLGATTLEAQQPGSFSETVRILLAGADNGSVRSVEREAVRRLYPPASIRPIWSGGGGGPTRQAVAALDLLANSEQRGLPSASENVRRLRAMADLVGRSEADAARFDVALSTSVVRLLADLHLGRVDPATAGADLPDAHDELDLASFAMAVAQATDVSAAVERAEPSYAGYRALIRALLQYRALATDTSLRPPARVTRSVRPGDAYSEALLLARYLVALGDADSTAARGVIASVDTTIRYEGPLVAAVVRFQRRHGLEPDSIIGPATMAELRVPLARRVRQIELALERWRWLPDEPPERYLVVNVPAFRLYVFEHDSTAAAAALSMNVIVGQAEGRHDTPVFAATMREVVFRPYWDVPPRIARTELIPIFRRRPAYFDHEGFEIVRPGAGDVPTTTFAPTSENLSRVANGTLRLRQRPGPANALGAVKFVFPNRYNVYLHGTPAQELFAQTRRDFSHGCIRIERPADLAVLVLRDQPPWTEAAIDSAMTGDRTVHVPIARPLSVFVLYTTVAVDDTGQVHFYPDIYRRDSALERALGLTPIAGR